MVITGKFSNLLTVQSQNGWPHIWMELDDNYPEVGLEIAAVGTGWELSQHNMIYAGTDLFGIIIIVIQRLNNEKENWCGYRCRDYHK